MSETELLRLLPPVLRARDFHLYTDGGKRLVDLYQEGGAAVLGHTPPNMLRELKNTASRGLFSALPHPLEKRFVKALSQLFPGRVIRVYASSSSLTGIIEKSDQAPWRPFVDAENSLLVSAAAAPVLIPVLPGLQGGGPFVLAIDPVFAEAHPFPPSDLLSPAFLAVAVRGVYDLIAAALERGNLRYYKINSALKKGGAWRRKGIYLFPKETHNPADWEKLFRRFLEGGFLLPPTPDLPVILPGILSPGEEAKLAGLLADCQV
ncbi:MAG: hypothetical protein LBN21_09070 [Treponema sp.]|jgi:hypothetical protein|nr:hypothetical protein [Treponema sp.]